MSEERLQVLGIDGLTGHLLEPMSVSEARSRVKRALLRPRPPRYGVATGDLASAGWGVVFPEGVDTAVRDALEPLLALRQRQAGSRYRELIYEPGEGAVGFRIRMRAGLGRVEPRQLPWYLLLVGDPESLPYSFEFDLGFAHAVGRLAFSEIADLTAYASRVVAAEERPRKRQPRAAVFAPTHPDDEATAACAEYLARPLAELARSQMRCTAVIGQAATRQTLLSLIRTAPDLLIAAGHSTVFRADSKWQRSLQGAVVCADWPGAESCPSIPVEHTVAAEDLEQGALENGVAILFGCHTAGTPQQDVFDSTSLEEANQLTPQPFIAALPQRLLGRSGGALAVLGHVGRAFAPSFRWHGAQQIGPYEDAVNALCDGCRIGEALDGFGQRFADLAIAWSTLGAEPDARHLDALDVWLAFHDARSWSLLGDPAVRLPLAQRHGAS